MSALPIVFDMETQDPDDALTLCLLLTHPGVRLHAISLNPGTRAQVGVVREILRRLDRADVPLGARSVEPGEGRLDVSSSLARRHARGGA